MVGAVHKEIKNRDRKIELEESSANLITHERRRISSQEKADPDDVCHYVNLDSNKIWVFWYICSHVSKNISHVCCSSIWMPKTLFLSYDQNI